MCQPDDRHRDRSMRRWNKATINREEEEETGGGGGGGGDCEKRTGSLAGWARRYRSCFHGEKVASIIRGRGLWPVGTCLSFRSLSRIGVLMRYMTYTRFVRTKEKECHSAQRVASLFFSHFFLFLYFKFPSPLLSPTPSLH